MEDPAFAPDPSSGIDLTTQSILLAASQHDLKALKPLLRVPGNASVQDPETGYTPLHAAIAACGPAPPIPTQNEHSSTEQAAEKEGGNAGEGEEEVDIEKAKKVIEELFFSGAIWNDLDANNETPGCMAYRLGRMELYEMCVNAGVRAELLLGLMGGYEELEGEASDEEMEKGEEVGTGAEAGNEEAEQKTNGTTESKEHKLAVGPAEEIVLSHQIQPETPQEPPQPPKQDVNSADYLASTLTFTDSALLDSDSNGVMMAWETSIMRRTVDLLLPSLTPGSRILNIGFGMGIIDRMFRDTKPARHHIIEAHPAVLQKLSEPSLDFGKTWEDSGPAEGGEGAYKIHAGKWQDICPLLLQAGEVYDAIYFDTFGEDYSQLKLFFTEFVPGLLDGEGSFGFFNGLGADRRVCYDVYCKVVEMDALEAGMDVEWEDVEVGELGGEGEGEWKGVRRRYWVLEKYRLPICRFLG